MTTRFPAAALAIVLGACSREPGASGDPRSKRGPMRYPVEVRPVEMRPVEYSVFAVGSVEAFETVQVTARVPGAVERVRFMEGDEVKEGDVLVEVEPRRYALALESARAALERTQAADAEARAALERRERAEAQSPGLIKGEELESFRARSLVAAAELAAARAAAGRAELDLRDARVRAPVGGVIETRTVQTGQYVQPGALLATLVRREPLLLRFPVPEGDAARIATGVRAFFRVREDPDERTATTVHVADAASEATRMVAVTARIDAPDDRLKPGAFAEVRVPVGGVAEAPVIPQLAVRPSERGFLAYVVEGDVARERVLQLGLRTPEGLVEVRSGLRKGERLIVRGAEALRDGAPVAPVGQKPPPTEPGAPTP